MGKPWCLYFSPHIYPGGCHVRGKLDLHHFRKGEKKGGGGGGVVCVFKSLSTATLLITHKYVKVNATIKNVMNWNSCVMPYDISLLNFYRPFRGPRWRGDFMKYSRRKSRRWNCGDPAVTADGPPVLPPHPGHPAPVPRPRTEAADQVGEARWRGGRTPGRAGPAALRRGLLRSAPAGPGIFSELSLSGNRAPLKIWR